MGQPQMQFTPQGFAPGVSGAVPATSMIGGGTMMSGMALSNGSYMGTQQQGTMPVNQGQNLYNMQQGQQQGQWNMSQVTHRTHDINPFKTHRCVIHFMLMTPLFNF